MPAHILMWSLKLTWLLFVLAFGACIGSLINVLVYRLPRGQGIVTPPSRCPACSTRLTWRENIPIFGWLLLRGRCRFCKAPISPEYPLVEVSIAALFGLFYILWYMVPPGSLWLGADFGAVRPAWTLGAVEQTWPTFVILLLLLGSLAAMTLIDARTFTIPLVLAWFPAAVGLLGHPLHALWVQFRHGRLQRAVPGQFWTIPSPDGWPWILAAAGAFLGIALATGLVGLGLLRRSFDDYEQWEQSRHVEPDGPEPSPDPAPPADAIELHAPEPLATPIVPDPVIAPPPVPPAPPRAARATFIVIPLLSIVAGAILAAFLGRPIFNGLLAGAAVGPLLAGLVFRLGRRPPAPEPGESDVPPPEALDDHEPAPSLPAPHQTPADTWTQYPHARREMVRELLFLAPCLALAFAGWRLGHVLLDQGHHPPLWAIALGGALLGYIIGGGVVWAVRILGSLAFGKEAMGLGDVHLMAAVGACIGWINSTLAFFLAAFVGIYFAILANIASGALRRAMPYGPFLAIATLLVLLFRPGLESLFSVLLGRAIVIP